MWTRSELKTKAKRSLKRNYIPCILVGLILLFALGSQQNLTYTSTGGLKDTLPLELVQSEQFQVQVMQERLTTFFLGPNQVIWNSIEAALGGMATILFLLAKILVFNPLEVGGCGFYVENAEDMPKLERLFKVFTSPGYKNVVLVLFERDLYLIFWFMLLVIPGIYKSFEYFMIPYILSDDPETSSEICFRNSKEMMYGEKLNAFILQLSFLLWELLSSITFGLSGIMFSNPYRHATFAEFYRVIRHRYWSQYQSEPDIYVDAAVRGE